MLENEYNYQLTEEFETEEECRRECKEIIEQIETYEGKGKGYRVKEDAGKWAVYTKGDMVDKKQTNDNNKDTGKQAAGILQYRDFLRRMK